MKPKFDVVCATVACSSRAAARAYRGALRSRALLAGACVLAFGGAAAAAPADGAAWEADWPIPLTEPRSAGAALDSSATAGAALDERAHWPDLDLSDEAIEPLRAAAQVGDVDAAVALAARLVERFEHEKTSDDLFEAVVWIDRYQGNASLARSGLIARVQQHDCRHRVLRLHWICDTAE